MDGVCGFLFLLPFFLACTLRLQDSHLAFTFLKLWHEVQIETVGGKQLRVKKQKTKKVFCVLDVKGVRGLLMDTHGRTKLRDQAM